MSHPNSAFISQSYEINLLGVDSHHSDQIISCHDFVLPYSSANGYFTKDISPLPGTLIALPSTTPLPGRPQNHQPEAHDYITVFKEGTQEILTIRHFSQLVLSGDFLAEADYWAQLSLVTQATVDACRNSLLESGRDVDVMQW
jgi:hypothetical protein